MFSRSVTNNSRLSSLLWRGFAVSSSNGNNNAAGGSGATVSTPTPAATTAAATAAADAGAGVGKGAQARKELFSVFKPAASRSEFFPFLGKVDELQTAEHAAPSLPPRSLGYSYRESVLPFSTNTALRDTYRGFFGDVRLGKVFEDLDAFAGGIAYDHADGFSVKRPLTIVTASVDRIILTARPPLDKDLRYSGGVEYVGKSSMSVGIRVHYDLGGGNWIDVLEAQFIMVARDRNSHTAAGVSPLKPETEDEWRIYNRARAQSEASKEFARQTKIRDESPPDREDLAEVHRLFRMYSPSHKLPQDADAAEMASTTLSSHYLMHPQNRNVHGKIFGGFLMRSAFEQAFTALYLFTGKAPLFSVVDEITFLAPVEIGSLLKFASTVVYTNPPYAMVETIATVIEPRTREHKITNKFHFTFDARSPKVVVPRTYEDSLTYVKAKRLLEQRKAPLPEYGQADRTSRT